MALEAEDFGASRHDADGDDDAGFDGGVDGHFDVPEVDVEPLAVASEGSGTESAGGWFRDPLKHHEYRFRDEQGWTRWVRHFGTHGEDPYWPSPAWYRDPSRRARYRFWDGDAWTAQTASRGYAIDDPVDAVWAPPLPHRGRNDLTLTPAPVPVPSPEESGRTVPPPVKRALDAHHLDLGPSLWRHLAGW